MTKPILVALLVLGLAQSEGRAAEVSDREPVQVRETGRQHAVSPTSGVKFAQNQGPVCFTDKRSGRDYSCPRADESCCKVSSGFKCCRPGDRCIVPKGCFVGVSLHFGPGWPATKEAQQQQLSELVTEIPDGQGAYRAGEAFKRWTGGVTIARVSRPGGPVLGPVLGVVSGQLNVYDSFFQVASKAEQTNVLTFELAKVLWYRVNGGDTSVAQTVDGRVFQKLLDDHVHAMSLEMLQSASLEGKNLAHLRDLDLQSRFAYAVRVAVLDLDAPAGAPPAVSSNWARARDEMRQYLLSVLKH
jgi:hypothetical protein